MLCVTVRCSAGVRKKKEEKQQHSYTTQNLGFSNNSDRSITLTEGYNLFTVGGIFLCALNSCSNAISGLYVFLSSFSSGFPIHWMAPPFWPCFHFEFGKKSYWAHLIIKYIAINSSSIFKIELHWLVHLI